MIKCFGQNLKKLLQHKRTKYLWSTNIRSRPAQMSNDGSMGTASIYYSSTSTIVIIWLEIGLRGRNAI